MAHRVYAKYGRIDVHTVRDASLVCVDAAQFVCSKIGERREAKSSLAQCVDGNGWLIADRSII